MDQNSFERLCQLARLKLSAAEQVEFERKFESLLGFVDKVQSREITAHETSPEHQTALELRRDLPEVFEWPEDFVHSYRVPKVIDFEEAE